MCEKCIIAIPSNPAHCREIVPWLEAQIAPCTFFSLWKTGFICILFTRTQKHMVTSFIMVWHALHSGLYVSPMACIRLFIRQCTVIRSHILNSTINKRGIVVQYQLLPYLNSFLLIHRQYNFLTSYWVYTLIARWLCMGDRESNFFILVRNCCSSNWNWVFLSPSSCPLEIWGLYPQHLFSSQPLRLWLVPGILLEKLNAVCLSLCLR